MLKSKSQELPTNRDLLNKIDNDITLLRGEIMELRETLKIIQQVLKIHDKTNKTTSSWW
tara:strand:+ start:115 stop:291 length:177 start_codon:yes stop_codon:yes gene_type:complete